MVNIYYYCSESEGEMKKQTDKICGLFFLADIKLSNLLEFLSTNRVHNSNKLEIRQSARRKTPKIVSVFFRFSFFLSLSLSWS